MDPVVSMNNTSSSTCTSTTDHDLEGRVEVTVQRLDGVAWVGGSKNNKNGKKRNNLPLLTATVSFSGSAEDMQIGSSTICGLTGQLLVESDPIHLDPSFQPTCGSPDHPLIISPEQAKDSVWLAAEWPEDVNTTTCSVATPQMRGNSNNNNNSSSNHARTVSGTSSECTTSTTTTSSQPHVRMHFPGAEVDPRIPKPCLSQSNRGSKIVHHHQHNDHNHHTDGMKVKNCTSSSGGLLETTETCSTTLTDATSIVSAHDDDEPLSLSSSSSQHAQQQSRFTGMENVQDNNNANANAAPIHFVRGESAFWSHSGDAMPEILELYIRLRCHDASTDLLHLSSPTFLEGVSFLVLFGQEDDCGCHVIDLPVRRPFLSGNPAESEDDLYFGGPGAASSPDTPRLLLTSQARLRLKVTIVPDKLRAARNINKRHNNNHHLPSSIPMTTSILDSNSSIAACSPHNAALDSPVEVCLTRSTLEAKLKPLMDKIRENELLALEQWQAQKRAMDVHVPMMMLNNSTTTQLEERNVKNSYFYYPARSPHAFGADGKNKRNDPNQHHNTPTCGSSLNDHDVCAGMEWSWDRVVNVMTRPCCGSCDGRFTHGCIDDPAEDYYEDEDGILRGPRGGGGPLVIDTAHFRDDNSTIATRDSWGI